MRLLDERFNRRTGACRVPLPDGWVAPDVRVTTELPPATAGAGLRRTRLRPRGAARVIRAARVGENRAGPTVEARPAPRFVDLDAARGLSPRASRIDRLIRSVLADPRALSARDPRAALADAARRAARRQDPVARADLVAEALGLLEPWIAGRLGKDLASASALERGGEWAVTWPPDGRDEATVFRGTTDVFARDAGGSWRAWVFSTPGASAPVERLRLLLSARAAEPLGLGPVVQGWRVGLGDGLIGEESFGDEVIAAAVRDALAAVAAA
jgi:ATP-dependent helicase/nuclease subunit A